MHELELEAGGIRFGTLKLGVYPGLDRNTTRADANLASAFHSSSTSLLHRLALALSLALCLVTSASLSPSLRVSFADEVEST